MGISHVIKRDERRAIKIFRVKADMPMAFRVKLINMKRTSWIKVENFEYISINSLMTTLCIDSVSATLI